MFTTTLKGGNIKITTRGTLQENKKIEKVVFNMKVVYIEEAVKTEVAEVTTNHSLTVEQALEVAGVTIADVAKKLGCDADEVDYNALQIEA